MKKYPKYKSSGIEWIDSIPESWITSKIKYLKEGEETLFIDGDWIESNVIVENGIRYITTGNIGVGIYKEQGGGYISEETFNELDCTEVFEGDLLISRLNPPIGRCCIIPNLNNRIVTSVDNVILRPNKKFNKKYLLYLFSSNEYFEHTGLIARGATMQRISRGLLGNICIPQPTLNEQTQIANYLDKKTKDIDKLIANKQKLIELLQEERTAIINQAVTKGINPKAKLKPSGIEWLGDVPEHWETGKFNLLVKIRHGHQFMNYDFTEDGIKIVKITQLHKDGFLDLSNCSYIAPNRLAEFQDIVINENDILMCLTGGTIGKIIRVGKVTEPLLQNYRVGHFSSIDSSIMDDDFIFWTMSSESLISQIFFQMRETGQPNIGMGDFSRMKITIPPINEQKDIVKHITKETNRISTIITKTEQEIELMKEYKTALISEVVTGKVDVRDEVIK